MLTYFQAIILGAVQGVSELFPISSLGHSVLLPALLHWQINEQDPHFLQYLVAVHFATALVLFFFFFGTWLKILLGLIRTVKEKRIAQGNTAGKVGWLLIIGTIPAGLLGLALQKQISAIFISPRFAALFLIGNGVLLFVAELLRRQARTTLMHGDAAISRLSLWQGFGVGLAQCLALIPGFSRTGASMSGGLIAGLSGEDALRFSFLLATPIIAAASVLKLPGLFSQNSLSALGPTFAGCIAAAVCAFFSIKFLSRYFSLENRSLIPFASYCLIVGIIATILLR